MGIMTRFMRLCKADMHGVIDRLEDKGLLLKQYLRLGGKLLGFNIDPDFGYVLDGLILVDLVQLSRTNPRQLERFMGKEGLQKFLAYCNRADGAGSE